MPSSLVSKLLFCLAAFIAGSIPFGFIAGRMKGIDLREHGSKNIGATNVLRVLGKGPGIAVLILDAAKGLLPILVAGWFLHGLPDEWACRNRFMAAILGHIYSPFVRFRGGKGVATALGVLIGLNPLVALITAAVFGVTVGLSRYVSLGSIIGAVAQAILFWVLPHHGLALPIFGMVVATFVILRHRANISRLLAGTENKFGAKKPEEAKEEETK